MSPGTNGFRSRQFARAIRVALLLSTVWLSSGCNYFMFVAYMIGGGFPTVQPDFEKMTKESLSDRGVKVAIVCFAPDDIRLNFTGVDKDIAKYTANRLCQHKLAVVHPDQVQAWLDKHEDWDKPEEVGEATGATHIICIDVHRYNLFEENSHELYRGRAEILISVYKMQKGEGAEKIYTKELTSLYPLSIARQINDMSYDHFRQQYLARLSEEIGRLFYGYQNGDDIADVI